MLFCHSSFAMLHRYFSFYVSRLPFAATLLLYRHAASSSLFANYRYEAAALRLRRPHLLSEDFIRAFICPLTTHFAPVSAFLLRSSPVFILLTFIHIPPFFNLLSPLLRCCALPRHADIVATAGLICCHPLVVTTLPRLNAQSFICPLSALFIAFFSDFSSVVDFFFFCPSLFFATAYQSLIFCSHHFAAFTDAHHSHSPVRPWPT